ncbi:DUF551 domain-containing protein [Yersinia proxima]|uniref:DUF551 domain-containing protein n=1 Tax=Yersinia proxima TaxID=2890316 RepID=UPI003D686CC3
MKALDRFTVEQLNDFIESDHAQCGDVAALARIALAAKRAEPNELADAVNEFLAVLDNYPEQLVPINRNSVPVKDLRKALSSDPQLNSPEMPDGWIDCNNELPKEDDLCLAIDDQGVIWTMLFEDDDFYPDTGGVCPNEITHWMPLPDSPEKP